MPVFIRHEHHGRGSPAPGRRTAGGTAAPHDPQPLGGLFHGSCGDGGGAELVGGYGDGGGIRELRTADPGSGGGGHHGHQCRHHGDALAAEPGRTGGGRFSGTAAAACGLRAPAESVGHHRLSVQAWPPPGYRPGPAGLCHIDAGNGADVRLCGRTCPGRGLPPAVYGLYGPAAGVAGRGGADGGDPVQLRLRGDIAGPGRQRSGYGGRRCAPSLWGRTSAPASRPCCPPWGPAAMPAGRRWSTCCSTLPGPGCGWRCSGW